MIARFWFVLLLPALAWGAIWPDNIGSFHLVSTAPATVSDRPLWDEFGLAAAQRATYASGNRKFDAVAYQFHDSTGAMAAFEWRRPADAKPSNLARLAVTTASGLLLMHGNYLLEFPDYRPSQAEAVALVEQLPNVDSSPLPALLGYLPAQGLVPNSERYIVGPEALAQFNPAIPPSVAAFHLGAEAQLGRFRTPDGEMNLTVFNYPTPQIAMQQVEQFQKLPDAMAKRSGPLVAVILAPPNRDAAERLLARVRYQATVTLNERVPTRRDNIGDLVINAFILIGFLLAFGAAAGLLYGGFRALRRRARKGADPEAMIVLHLE